MKRKSLAKLFQGEWYAVQPQAGSDGPGWGGEYAGTVRIYLSSHTGEFPATVLKVEMCSHGCDHSKGCKVLTPDVHFIVPENCFLSTENPDIISCENQARLNIELMRPLIGKCVRVSSPVKSIVSVANVGLIPPSLISDPENLRFHQTASFQSDSSFPHLTKGSIAASLANNGRPLLEQLAYVFSETETPVEVEKLLDSQTKLLLYNKLAGLDSWLQAATFGDDRMEIIVGIDASMAEFAMQKQFAAVFGCDDVVKESDKIDCSRTPSWKDVRKLNTGFLKYAFKFTETYTQSSSNSHLLRTGLYGGGCLGLCGEPWEKISMPNSIKVRSLAAPSSPIRVRIPNGDGTLMDMGIMHFFIRQFDMSISDKEITAEFGFGFPQNSNFDILGSNIEVVRIPEKISDMALTDRIIMKRRKLATKGSVTVTVKDSPISTALLELEEADDPEVISVNRTTSDSRPHLLEEEEEDDELKDGKGFASDDDNLPSLILRMLSLNKAKVEGDQGKLKALMVVKSDRLVHQSAMQGLLPDVGYRQITEIGDPITGIEERFFRILLTFRFRPGHLDIVPPKSRMLSIPLRAIINAKVDSGVRNAETERLDAMMKKNIRYHFTDESADGLSKRLSNYQPIAFNLFQGSVVMRDNTLVPQERGIADPSRQSVDFGSPLPSFKFSGTIDLLDPEKGALRPISSPLRNLMKSVGFGRQARLLERTLIFTKRGLAAVIGHHYVELGGDKVAKDVLCKKIIERLFGEAAKSNILTAACNDIKSITPAVNENNQLVVENTIVSAVRQRLYEESFKEAFGTGDNIPSQLRFITEIFSDGTIGMGIVTPESIKALAPLLEKRLTNPTTHVPSVIAIKIWTLLSSTVLGGRYKPELKEMVATEPISVVKMTVTQIPLQKNPQGGGGTKMISTESRPVTAGFFDTTYIMRGLITSNHPSTPHIFCVKCAEKFGVLTNNPFRVGLDLLMTTDCVNKEFSIFEKMQAAKKSGIKLPFISHQMSLSSDCVLAKFVCRDGVSLRFGSCQSKEITTNNFAESFTSLLSSAPTLEKIPLRFPFFSTEAVVMMTNPQAFEKSHDTLEATNLLRQVTPQNLRRFADIIHTSQLADSTICDKRKEKRQDWETARVDSRHPNSLSPFGFRKIIPRETGSMEDKLLALLPGSPYERGEKAVKEMQQAVQKLRTTVDAVHGKPSSDTDNNFFTFAFDRVVNSFSPTDPTAVLGTISGFGGFLVDDLLDAKLRGAFYMRGLTAPRSMEMMLEGVIKYTFHGALKIDVMARGRIRILDKSGPVALRLVNDELHIEGHLATEDIRLFLVVKETLNQANAVSYSVRLRVGSGQLSSEKDLPGQKIKSCWWGQGKQVKVQELEFLLKAFTDDTLNIPKLTDDATFDAVEIEGTPSKLAKGKGRMRFFSSSGECFRVELSEWFEDMTWQDFDKKCDVSYRIEHKPIDPLDQKDCSDKK